MRFVIIVSKIQGAPLRGFLLGSCGEILPLNIYTASSISDAYEHSVI